MIVKSINIGLPRQVEWKGETVLTGIFKYPVEHAVTVLRSGIEGDGQADLVNHGGLNKTVYVYASEHYDYWNRFLQTTVETGAFGENITTEGLLDNEVFVGDEFQFGECVLMAVQPRMPCFKLGIRFNDRRMTRHFFEARMNGIYFKVKQEGMVKKDDTIRLIGRSAFKVTIQDIVDNYVLNEKDEDKVRQIVDLPMLPDWIRNEFIHILRKIS